MKATGIVRRTEACVILTLNNYIWEIGDEWQS